MTLQKSFEVPFKACLGLEGGSNLDASLDYSSTQGVYEITDSGIAGIDRQIDKLVFVIVSASAATNSSQFGNIAGLTNGVTVKLDVASTEVYTLGTYKSLLDLDLVSDSHYDEVLGTDHIYEYEFKFDTPITLKGGRGDRLYVELDDNLSSLNGLYFSASGKTNTAKFSV